MVRLSLMVPVIALLALASGCTPRAAHTPASQGGMSLVPASDVAVPDYAGDVGPAQVFEVLRPLDQPITLGRLYPSCTCLSLSSEKTSFEAGERALITMRVVDHPVPGNAYTIDVGILQPTRTTIRRQVFPIATVAKPAEKPAEPTLIPAQPEAETKAAEPAPAEPKVEETPVEEKTEEAQATVAPEGMVISRWWLARAFPIPDRDAAMSTVFPPEDGTVDLEASYPGGIDGATVTWKVHDGNSDGFGVGGVNLGSGDDRVAYAYTTLVSDEDRDVLFVAGSDDGLAVWVNGAQVWRIDVLRAFTDGVDRFPVRLKKGDNAVLLKITQGGGEWGFNVRVADSDGKSLAAGALDVR